MSLLSVPSVHSALRSSSRRKGTGGRVEAKCRPQPLESREGWGHALTFWETVADSHGHQGAFTATARGPPPESLHSNPSGYIHACVHMHRHMHAHRYAHTHTHIHAIRAILTGQPLCPLRVPGRLCRIPGCKDQGSGAPGPHPVEELEMHKTHLPTQPGTARCISGQA